MLSLLALLAGLVVSQPNPYQVVVTMQTPTASATASATMVATPTPAPTTIVDPLRPQNAAANAYLPNPAELALFTATWDQQARESRLGASAT